MTWFLDDAFMYALDTFDLPFDTLFDTLIRVEFFHLPRIYKL